MFFDFFDSVVVETSVFDRLVKITFYELIFDFFLLFLYQFFFLGFVFSPGVFGYTEVTGIFDSEVIFSSNDLEKSLFSPGFTPRISYKPIRGSILSSPSNN